MAMSLTKQGVLTLLRGCEDQLRRLHVQKLGLFGSFVRGEARNDSDVDVLVEFEPGYKTFDNFFLCLKNLEFTPIIE